MLRISKIVDYGILVLTHMAARPTHVCSATELAAALGLGQPVVSKVLKLLAQHGMVSSTRGARGGYRLAREPGQIHVAAIIDALEEQPFGLTECTAMPGACSVESACHIRSHWQRINLIVRRTLESVTLADMVVGAPTVPVSVAPVVGAPLYSEYPELESVQMSTVNDKLDSFLDRDYEAGFVTEIEAVTFPKGLDEDVIRRLSAVKREPEFMLEWRLKAYRQWLKMSHPTWAKADFQEPDFQDISYFSAPKSKKDGPKSLDEVDPELLRTYEKLGVPLHERAKLAGVAVDAVFDSVSVATTFRKQLADVGIIFCSFSEALRTHPELVQKYMGTVVPPGDNFYAALNSAVFSDGSFVYIPKGVKCPMELSTYFRINNPDTGQFERTLIIAEEGASVSYLEGCTAPMRDENQLHAAVVELVALEDARIKYSTVQNWYPGDENGVGGIYNFVTKRGDCRGARSHISWTQVETGSAITWKYPSVILRGDDSTGEFYSVALSNHRQQADTGTKMIHMGRNTRSTIISKGISAGHGSNTFRGLVRMTPKADNARNYTQCDSLLIGKECAAHTFPTIEVQNPSASVEHEATASRIAEDQLFYAMQRGLSAEDAVSMIVNGFCKEVFKELPMEFAVEAQNLLGVSLEGSVG